MIDLAIIGSGPAALSAAIYAARANLKVQVFEKNKIGGALTEISQIGNFPGFIGAGKKLAENLKEQAIGVGAKISYGDCSSINPLIIDGERVDARAILLATGTEPKKLDIEIQKPISYCALCDAPLYKNKNVAIIGGANSAIQEAIHVAGIASEVSIYSHSRFKAEPSIISAAKKIKNITFHENTEVTPEILNKYDGIFVFIGKCPATSFLPKEILDEKGYIKTNNHVTEIDNVFAAGDVRDGSTKQAITAAADGVEAAIEIINFLKNN